MKCPICEGTGEIEEKNNAPSTKPVASNFNHNISSTQMKNLNILLFNLEVWLRGLKEVKFDHTNKTMNTYVSFSSKKWGEKLGLSGFAQWER
jgi:hypothetical protein